MTIALCRAISLAALSIVAALLTVCSNAGNSAAAGVTETSCSAKQVAKISISALNGVPVVIPIANGVPVTLMLDTGAERTVLTPEAAQRVRGKRCLITVVDGD